MNVRTYLQLARLTARRRRTLLLILLALLFLALTAGRGRAQEVPPQPVEISLPVPPFRTDAPRGPVVVQGGTSADPIVNALDEYRRTGNARTIEQSTYVAYPYGHSQPTLTCAPLRACVIELEDGEVLMAVIAGDTERWIMEQAFTGRSGTTPLVVVKPTGYDLTTNLVLSTDRRIYELTLDAPPARTGRGEDANPQALYTRRIRFYYPDDMVRAALHREARLEHEARNVITMNPGFRLENLNFNYEWSREKGFPFDLEQVFDDGAHTYLKLPSAAANDVAPVLFITAGGERQLLNYTVRAAGEASQYYITDRVFREGVLVVGARDRNWIGRSKHSEETLRIRNLDRK
jgi:type IV secretion system protein VirB9